MNKIYIIFLHLNKLNLLKILLHIITCFADNINSNINNFNLLYNKHIILDKMNF